MKIDHAEAMQRARDFLVITGQLYAGRACAERIADLIERAVADAECPVCRQRKERERRSGRAIAAIFEEPEPPEAA
jgi:hypothetical protein